MIILDTICISPLNDTKSENKLRHNSFETFHRFCFEVFFKINYFRVSVIVFTSEKCMISYIYEMKNTNDVKFYIKNIKYDIVRQELIILCLDLKCINIC